MKEEYISGERNGKGKEYNIKGELWFECEYLYGERIKGKEYIKGNIVYDGEFLFGRL